MRNCLPFSGFILQTARSSSGETNSGKNLSKLALHCRLHAEKMTAMRLVSSILLIVLLQYGVLGARRFRGGRNPQPRRAPPSPTYRDRGDTTESFPLDFTAVEENMDNFMTQVKNLAQSLYPCSAQKLDYDMKLHFLENTSVTCNDGTPAGYVFE